MKTLWSCLALAATSLAPGILGAADFAWEGRLAAGKTVEIKGINGGIEARGGGEVVRVEAHKRARRDDPDSVRIEVVEHADGVTLCAVYPGRGNECTPGPGGRMKTRDNDVAVEFTVWVPDGVRFVGRSVNGGIEARNLTADAEAHTVNGGVVVEAGGHVRAETVNGSIKARMGRADWSGDLDFSTVNGSIALDLPEPLHARVEASTVNGSIETDFPIQVTGRFSKRRASGTIGNGGRELNLKTVNGSIKLRKAP